MQNTTSNTGGTVLSVQYLRNKAELEDQRKNISNNFRDLLGKVGLVDMERQKKDGEGKLLSYAEVGFELLGQPKEKIVYIGTTRFALNYLYISKSVSGGKGIKEPNEVRVQLIVTYEGGNNMGVWLHKDRKGVSWGANRNKNTGDKPEQKTTENLDEVLEILQEIIKKYRDASKTRADLVNLRNNFA